MKKVIIIFSSAMFALPVFATFVVSFMSLDNFTILSLDNYRNLLFNAFIFYPMFWNSILYAAVITLVQFVIIIPCAFGFAQARFRGKGALFIFYIILMMMPLQVTILPNYIGLRELGLLNTRLGIIFPAVFSPFGVIVLRQYMKSIDNSAVEAMRLETNSILTIMVNCVIPQIKVCLFAVGLFVFADCLNMLEQPLLFLDTNLLQTLPVMLSETARFEGNILFPASVLFMIPVLLLYGYFNGSLEKGLTLGELK